MTLVFCSDVHAPVMRGGGDRHLPFIKFLQYLQRQDIDGLFILGDLFDFWFEFGDVVFGRGLPILKELSNLADIGVDLHFLVGNHDYWAGRFMEEQVGIEVHKGPIELKLGKKRVLLCHGDGLNPEDRGYLFMRKVLRSPWTIAAFRLFHPELALRIGRWASSTSREQIYVNLEGKRKEAEAIRAFAERQILERARDVVIAGHCHIPVIEEFSSDTHQGTYYNLGDWLRHYTFLVYENGTFRYCRFDPETRQVSEWTDGSVAETEAKRTEESAVP